MGKIAILERLYGVHDLGISIKGEGWENTNQYTVLNTNTGI